MNFSHKWMLDLQNFDIWNRKFELQINGIKPADCLLLYLGILSNHQAMSQRAIEVLARIEDLFSKIIRFECKVSRILAIFEQLFY